jgi:hypothetical protein
MGKIGDILLFSVAEKENVPYFPVPYFGSRSSAYSQASWVSTITSRSS